MMMLVSEASGVARPMENSVGLGLRLIHMAKGMRTSSAPTRPCAITNTVLPQPLK